MAFLPRSPSFFFIPRPEDFLARVLSSSSHSGITPSLFTQSLSLSSPGISLVSKIRLYYSTLHLALKYMTGQMAIIYQFPVEVSSDIISSESHLKFNNHLTLLSFSSLNASPFTSILMPTCSHLLSHVVG